MQFFQILAYCTCGPAAIGHMVEHRAKNGPVLPVVRLGHLQEKILFQYQGMACFVPGNPDDLQV